MHSRKFDEYGKRKHKGAILISAILWCICAIGAAVLTQQAAEKIYGPLSWKTHLIKRENLALEAEYILRDWFTYSVEGGSLLAYCEFEPGSGAKEDPYIEYPEDLLSELRESAEDFMINAKIIDQNYSDAFVPEARSMDISRGMPSHFEIEYQEASPDICNIRRFQLRVEVSSVLRQEKPLVTATGIYVIKDVEGNMTVLPLYTKKQ